MEIRLTDGAVQDLATLPNRIAGQILKKIERLRGGLVGDIKALRGISAGYRLRSGDYRILFDVHENVAIIQQIKHRRVAYE
jgi:mRNA-degrading endonuclease RelE of RelBE toxin-antitoxin system